MLNCRQGRLSHGHLHTWSDVILGLLCPVPLGHCHPEAGAAGILCTAFSAATGFSGAAGLSGHSWGIRMAVTLSSIPLVLHSSYSSILVHVLQTELVELSCPGVLGRGKFVELWMLYGCRLKVRRQRETLTWS